MINDDIIIIAWCRWHRGSHLPWPRRRTSCGSCPARRHCLALPLQYLAAAKPGGNLRKCQETWDRKCYLMLFGILVLWGISWYFGRTNHGRSNMSVLICINLLVIYSRHVARCSAFWTRCVFLQIFMHLGRMRININPKGSNFWSLWRREKWKNC